MADRNNFRVVGGRSEAEASLTKRIRMHKLQSMLRVSIIAVVLVILLLMFIIQYKNQVFSGYVISKQAEFTVLESTSYLENNGNIIR